MKCILYLLVALLSFGTSYSQEIYYDYNTSEVWDAKTFGDAEFGATILGVNTVITRINGTVYTHDSHTF